jgi:DNA-binding transcriptional MerR regulator
VTSKYRRYPTTYAPRVRFVHRAAELGLSLAEIGGLLALRDHVGGAAKARAGALAKAADLQERILALERVRAGLLELAEGAAALQTKPAAQS